MTNEELDRLEKREREASPAPWKYDEEENFGENWLLGSFGFWERWPDDPKRAELGMAILTTDRIRCSNMVSDICDARADAELCADVRNALPALIAQARRWAASEVAWSNMAESKAGSTSIPLATLELLVRHYSANPQSNAEELAAFTQARQALALRAALEAFVLAYENPGGAYDVSDAYEAAVKVLGELGK
uniref:Uncharacterized protein n=1 Tax=viral metagenome TaxID=1070528 RepID=A0A6H1ZZQ2_9ZZZZ